MKTLHGKRHIRARKSVVVGREKRQLNKLNRLSDKLGIASKASMEVARYTEEFVKAFTAFIEQCYQGAIVNSDGTYTHTWNFEEKGQTPWQ